LENDAPTLAHPSHKKNVYVFDCSGDFSLKVFIKGKEQKGTPVGLDPILGSDQVYAVLGMQEDVVKEPGLQKPVLVPVPAYQFTG